MANANKQKGDRAERAVRDYVVDRYPGSFKTRAGFDDDLGDVVVAFGLERVVLQVKDVAAALWKKWHGQVAEQVETRLDSEQVRRGLASLTERQYQAVTLAYYGGYTHQEIATLLDLPLGTVKTRLRDGLIRLRDHLGVAR